MAFNSSFNSGGGSRTITDLDVDSGTLSVDEINNRVGIGDTAPGTKLQVTDTAPYVTIQNSTSENSAGGCESKIIFEDHGNNALGQVEVSHVGSSDDEKGQLIIKTNNDSGLQTALTIDEAQKGTFAGAVSVNSAFAAAGASGTFATFADGDATPSVALGNLWKHHASTQTITMFDGGIAGQTLTVISTADITYDVTSTNLKGGSADIVTASGDVTTWTFDGTNWYLQQFMDVSADHSTIGGGGGGETNDLSEIVGHQIFS